MTTTETDDFTETAADRSLLELKKQFVKTFIDILMNGLLIPWAIKRALRKANKHDARVPAFGFMTCFWLHAACRNLCYNINKKQLDEAVDKLFEDNHG